MRKKIGLLKRTIVAQRRAIDAAIADALEIELARSQIEDLSRYMLYTYMRKRYNIIGRYVYRFVAESQGASLISLGTSYTTICDIRILTQSSSAIRMRRLIKAQLIRQGRITLSLQIATTSSRALASRSMQRSTSIRATSFGATLALQVARRCQSLRSTSMPQLNIALSLCLLYQTAVQRLSQRQLLIYLLASNSDLQQIAPPFSSSTISSIARVR